MLLSEHKVQDQIVPLSLMARGLNNVQLITSDDHPGVKAAWIALFGGNPLATLPVSFATYRCCAGAEVGNARVIGE